MILLGFNAHLTQIQSPATPGDPSKNIPSSPATVRWSGDAQCYIDEDIGQVIRGGTRAESPVLIGRQATVVDLPANLPVWPNISDLVTIVRAEVLIKTYSQDQPKSLNYVVRMVDGGLLLLGKIRLLVVRS